MNKLRLFPLSAVLIIALTACSFRTASPSPSASPSPVESLPPAQGEHLEFYDQFDRYNNGIDEHDFEVAEVVIEGTLHYCFHNREYEYPILIFATPGDSTDPYPYQATLELHGSQNKPLEFEMPIFILGYGNVSGVADFYLEDLTGDDMPELIYIYGAGGTGVWEDSVKVFDLTTMTECSISYDPVLLADGLNVFVGNYNAIGLQDDQLVLTVLYTEEDSLMVDYVGSLSAPFAFDPDSSSFSLDTSHIALTEFDDNT